MMPLWASRAQTLALNLGYVTSVFWSLGAGSDYCSPGCISDPQPTRSGRGHRSKDTASKQSSIALRQSRIQGILRQSDERRHVTFNCATNPECKNDPQESKSLHETLPNLPSESIAEVSVYFNESWGNRTRIDYGSGMELNFLCWM
jgi:Phosphotyrosyl phosphate activator (PTPA) protein